VERNKVRKGVSSGYYLPESMPLVLCGACLVVVLLSSEKAREVYGKLVESYRLPGMQVVLSKLETELPRDKLKAMWHENIEGLRIRRCQEKEGGESLFPDVDFYKGFNVETTGIADWLTRRFESEAESAGRSDLEHWWGLVGELIKVGFNRGADQVKGIYKVTAERSSLLVQAIQVRSLGEYKGIELVGEEGVTALRLGARTYDLTELLADSPTTRKHRVQTKSYKQGGYRLRHGDRIARMACLWYYCRVVYSGPEEFCMEVWKRDTDTVKLEASNVSNEIRACDEAIGYPRGE